MIFLTILPVASLVPDGRFYFRFGVSFEDRVDFVPDPHVFEENVKSLVPVRLKLSFEKESFAIKAVILTARVQFKHVSDPL